MNEVNGHCLCGAVRFTAASVDPHFHACHCGMCRRWSGGPMFAANASEVKFEGTENLRRYDSSEWAARGFCAHCGSSLFYYFKPGDRYLMAVGAFDDASRFRLIGEIYVDHKPPGYDLAGDITRQTEAEFLAQFNTES